MNKSSKKTNVIKYLLIALTLFFLTVIIILPMLYVLTEAFSMGFESYLKAITSKNTLSALKLTLLATLISIIFNLLFGLSIGWSLGKFPLPYKRVLIALIELPLSISPVITGLTFILFLGKYSTIGAWLDSHGIDIIYAFPGIALCTMFVTSPYIAREIIPLMQEAGKDEEEAALILGAGGLRTFFYVTLPNIKWGVIYGILITNARAMGEFGAVSVVSGNIRGKTETLTLHVEALYEEYNLSQSFAVASILTICAIITLIIKSSIENKNIIKKI